MVKNKASEGGKTKVRLLWMGGGGPTDDIRKTTLLARARLGSLEGKKW